MVLVNLFVLLWSLVGGEYEWRNELPESVVMRAPYAQGAFSCAAGVGWVLPTASMEIVVHELAHAYDCSDDGELNGSPGHNTAEAARHVSHMLGYELPATWQAERYAYEVTRTGRLR